jgi:hypothetical protein
MPRIPHGKGLVRAISTVDIASELEASGMTRVDYIFFHLGDRPAVVLFITPIQVAHLWKFFA